MVKREIRLQRQHYLAFFLGAALSAASLTAAAYQHPYSVVPEDAATSLETDAAGQSADELIGDSEAAASTGVGGCGKKAPRIGDFTLSTVDGAGKTRTYQVLVPGNYSDTHAYAVVFVFHGAGGNGAQSYSWGLQNAPGAAGSAIFVFPTGSQFAGYGNGWYNSKNGRDMAFFDNMLKTVEADYCINTARVFAAGFSWGGDFVVTLSCARGALLRAVAINSTTDGYRVATDANTYDNLPCPSTLHPHVRFEHAKNGDSEYPAPLFATTMNLYRRFHECGVTSKPIASSFSGMSCVSYNGCHREVLECAFPTSLGHVLPPNWAKDTWAFLSQFQ